MSVTPSEVAAELGRPAPDSGSDQYKQWELWIADAVGEIDYYQQKHHLPDPDSVVLDRVVRRAVAAQVRRPDDATQVSVAIDDGRVERTYTSGSGQVTIRPDWWRLLWPNFQESGAFSTRPAYVPDRPI